MMKNKLFIPLFILTMGFGLVACQPEVDVLGINQDIAQGTLIGTDSARSVCFVTGTTMRIVEYKFLPDNKATRTECIFGDGLNTSNSVKYSYVMDFMENGYGCSLLFTPEDVTPENANAEPINVDFIGNVLVEIGGDTITDVNSKCDKLESIVGQLSNTTWYYKDSTLWADTIPVFDYIKVDTTLKPVIGRGPDGKPTIIRVDTIFKQDSIFKDSISIVGVKSYNLTELTFNRDLKFYDIFSGCHTFANTGSYSYEHAEFTKELVKVDSTSEYTSKKYRWGLSSISTGRRFGIRTVSDDENKETVDYAISLFMEPVRDKDKKVIGYTMKVDGATEFKLKKQ